MHNKDVKVSDGIGWCRRRWIVYIVDLLDWSSCGLDGGRRGVVSFGLTRTSRNARQRSKNVKDVKDKIISIYNNKTWRIFDAKSNFEQWC
ncbi:hypothetical protein [Paenibacillus uliginis]|uniref:hypothetical protein n=1 Tax=Paenibacillus uliginis TaxID=683737 RepID=UPI001AECFA89|nr:hypothetical protein [Paenibacillus uliginis]